MRASPGHGPCSPTEQPTREGYIMSEQESGNGQAEVYGTVEDLSLLQQAADLLNQGRDSTTYEEGTSMAVMSLASSVLHMALTQCGPRPTRAELVQLEAKWQREAVGLRSMGETSAAAAIQRCASDLLRAMAGGVLS